MLLKSKNNYFILLAVLLFVITPLSHGTVRVGKLDPGKVVNLPDWSNGGDISSFVDFCVLSQDGNGKNAPIAPYQIRAFNNTIATDPYYLEHLTDPTQKLFVSWEHTDLLPAGGGTETLTPNQFTAQNKTGANNRCPAGINSRLTLHINAADLFSVSGGSYRMRFVVEVQGGTNGTETKTGFLTVNLTITPLIQISGLQDIFFPPYTGADLVSGYSLCVYRNGVGTYSLTASGSGAGGAFTITNGVDLLPYTATWNDTAVTSNIISNTALTGRQNPFTANPTCNSYSANNATIQITILATDLGVAASGTYSGIMTLIVAPE